MEITGFCLLDQIVVFVGCCLAIDRLGDAIATAAIMVVDAKRKARP